MCGAHTCFPLVNYKFAIGQGHKHLVIQIPEKKEVTMQFQRLKWASWGQGTQGDIDSGLESLPLFILYPQSVCVGGDLRLRGSSGRHTAGLGAGLCSASSPEKRGQQSRGRRTELAYMLAKKTLGGKGNPGPYRMQVTEAACWSFMLFLRSRMLSEDW